MKTFKKCLGVFFIVFSVVLLISAFWGLRTFDNVCLEEIIFQLLVPMKGANTSYFLNYFLYALIPIVTLSIILLILYLHEEQYKIDLKLNIKKKKKEINFNFLSNKNFYVVLLFIFTIFYTFKNYDVINFVNNQFTTSNFIEENYVDPNTVKLEFPKKKRNLIYIYLESMESSYTDTLNGGVEEDNLIPKLTKIANNNISFSNSEKLGGFSYTFGASWTISAMVAQSAGIPLKISIDGNSYNLFEKFLPGVTTLGDILENEGYNQMVMFGSDAAFAGRNYYYAQHGNYQIYDLYSAIDDGKMAEEDIVWWGFEDKDLYSYAKEQILNLAKEDAPFNFTMLTVDTHAYEGYLSDSCEEKFDTQYANVIYCADKQIDSFLKWLKKQDFYKDTTIVIVGDHLTMDTFFINDSIDINDRKVYNGYINSVSKASNTTNREFLTFDLFPTTLAAMGVNIENNRLGLGANLFSDIDTLAEKYGSEYINSELAKKSVYYNKKFIYKKNID